MSLRHRHNNSATTSLSEKDALFAPNRILTNAEQELVLERLSRDYRTSTVFIRVLGVLHFILACLYVILALLGITFTSGASETRHHNTKATNANKNELNAEHSANYMNKYIVLPSWESFMSFMSRVILLLSSIVLASCGTSILCANRSLRLSKDDDLRNNVKSSRRLNTKMTTSKWLHWRNKVMQIGGTNAIHFYAMLLTSVFTCYWLLLWCLETHLFTSSHQHPSQVQTRASRIKLSSSIMLAMCYCVQLILVFWQPLFHLIVFRVMKSTGSAQSSLASLSRKTYNYDKW